MYMWLYFCCVLKLSVYWVILKDYEKVLYAVLIFFYIICHIQNSVMRDRWRGLTGLQEIMNKSLCGLPLETGCRHLIRNLKVVIVKGITLSHTYMILCQMSSQTFKANWFCFQVQMLQNCNKIMLVLKCLELKILSQVRLQQT